MLTRTRFKALVFTVSLLTIGLLGNFHPLLVNEVESHDGAHAMKKEKVTSESSTTRLRYVNKPCPYCGKLRLYTKYERVITRRVWVERYYWYHVSISSGTWIYDKGNIETRVTVEPISTSSMCYNHQCPQHGGG